MLSINDIVAILHKEKITGVSDIEKCVKQSSVSNVYICVRETQEDLILKVFSRRFHKKQIEASIKAQDLLARNNLAPKIISLKHGLWTTYKGYNVCVMEKIVTCDKGLCKYDAYEYGKLLGKVHKVLETLVLYPKAKYLRHKNYYYNKTIFFLLHLKYKKKNMVYDQYLKRQNALIDDYIRYKKVGQKSYQNYSYVHGDFRKANILVAKQSCYLIDFDQVSFFSRAYEIFKYVFREIDSNYNLTLFEKNLKQFMLGYREYNALSDNELLYGFSYYYYVYISDFRSYQKKYQLKDNDEYLAKRLKYCEWYYQNYGRIITIIQSVDG